MAKKISAPDRALLEQRVAAARVIIYNDALRAARRVISRLLAQALADDNKPLARYLEDLRTDMIAELTNEIRP
jgi:alkylation response protein AidB-like acyl-CoA dehydrogenase